MTRWLLAGLLATQTATLIVLGWLLVRATVIAHILGAGCL